MAKTQKYPEDQLLEAVVKFSEIEKKKIKATELARWCRENIEGLEEVRDYHFTRPVKEKDVKTKKMVEKPKLCTFRIEEINKSRSLAACINTNILLKATSIDSFMVQPAPTQRKMIVETRQTVDKLLVKNANLMRENEAIKSENKTLKTKISDISDRVIALQKAQLILHRQVMYLMKVTDETARKAVLAKMGISDEMIDLDAYTKSLRKDVDTVTNLNKILREYLNNEAADMQKDTSAKNDGSLSEDVLSGIEF